MEYLSWLKILESLAPRYKGIKLEERIHRMLKKAEDYAPDKKDEFKEEMDLLTQIMGAHLLYKEERGQFNDMFGDYLMETERLNDRAGQFFTPIHIVKMMCQITLPLEELDKKINFIGDPAAGCGRFMLGTAEVYHKELGYYNFIAYNTDIDFRMYVFCTMNAILHAIPSLNAWGDSLAYKFWEGTVVLPGPPTMWKILTGEEVFKAMPKPPKTGLDNFIKVLHPARARRSRSRKKVPSQQKMPSQQKLR